MSEYQYYEWQTVDRPLTASQKSEVERLSSHMEVVTSTQAIVTYSWGDFKHDPEQVLLTYFDAFLYEANWGTFRLMFRFPKSSIDAEAIRPYCLGDQIRLNDRGAYFILEFSLDEEEGEEWVEAEGTLGQLIPIREQIIQGDYRALYLGWLGLADSTGGRYDKGDEDDEWDEEEPEDELEEYEEDYDEDEYAEEPQTPEDLREPPVPAGLGHLTASLQNFIDFFGIDPFVVQAAAQSSPTQTAQPDEKLQAAVGILSRAECEDFLLRLLKDEPQVRSALRKRLAELAGVETPAGANPQRSLAELRQAADELRQEAARQAQIEAERKRVAALKELAKREEAAWRQVDTLIQEKKARPYDEAVALLVQLRELAQYEHRLPAFQRRFAEIRDRYASSTSLTRRFQDAGLLAR
jgi:hypothetical protein